MPAARNAEAQALLARLQVFRGAASEALARLAAAALPLELGKGEWLLRWGERCTGFYAVARGSIKVAFLSSQGEEKVLAIALPGQSFGESLLFLEQPCPVSARALVDSALLHIPGRVLGGEIARDAGFARSLLGGLSRRLHALLRDVGADARRSGPERVVAYLLRGVPPGSEAPQVTLPRKSALASRLSMTPEHFSRVLHRLEAAQLIEVRGRAVRLVDLERLRDYPGGRGRAADEKN